MMAAPHTLGDTMRAHDKAVYQWLNTLLVDYGNQNGVDRNNFPILRVFASPYQAFAKVVDLLVLLRWLPGNTAEEMRTLGADKWPELPLPIITIERDEPTPDPELNSAAPVRRVYLNPLTGQWETHRWPAHYTTQYRLTLWSNKRYTDNFLREWIYSKLGGVGLAHQETLLDVTHPMPWGLTKQKFRFDGSADLSTLEGNTARYIRSEFSFTLRTLVFWPAEGSSYLNHGVTFDGQLISAAYGDTTDQGLSIPSLNVPAIVPAQLSANLFYYPVSSNLIPTQWPHTANAKVSAGQKAPGGIPVGSPTPVSLRAQVTSVSDSVELVERLTNKDADGLCLISVSMLYQSSGAPVELEVAQRNATTNDLTSAFSRPLPAARDWSPVHVFTLVKGDTVQVNLVGTGTPGDVTVAEVDIREVASGTKITPQATSSPGPGLTRHEWGSLDNAPYLVILALDAGNAAGPNNVLVQDDLGSPTYTATQVLDSDLNIGLVFLVQPKNGQLGLTVPSALVLDTVHLQRYPGPYNGSTV